MAFTRGSNKNRRGSTVMLLTIMMPFFLIPLIGIGVDGTRLAIVQSKLQSAVDGAGLGAGRLLGTPADTAEIAGEFLKANFPDGYWGTTNFQKSITYTSNLGVQTITVTASCDVPLTFMRVAGFPKSASSATSIVTRRVTRVVMVLDRSGSMNNTDPISGKNVFTVMKAGAKWFASQFTPGYDELGLVVFSGSAVVAYPSVRPWDNSPTGGGGPDKSFATNPATQTGPIFDQLTAMAVGGGTGTTEALSLAYIELQKTHNRDLLAQGTDNTLNTIVLFTDGVPDAISVYANDPNNNSLKAKAATPCKYNPATATDTTTQMRGYLVAPGSPVSSTNPYPGWGTSEGLINIAAYDSAHTLSWWMGSSGASDLSTMAPSSALTNCTALGRSGNMSVSSDLAKIPDHDIYGNPTGGLAFKNSQLYDGKKYWYPNTGNYDANTPATGYNIAAASWNSLDAMGNTIRSQNFMKQVQIFCIGYSGNGGTDVGLLNRLANVPASTSYDKTQSKGQVYLVNDADQLQAAFSQVASSVLRLAQ